MRLFSAAGCGSALFLAACASAPPANNAPAPKAAPPSRAPALSIERDGGDSSSPAGDVVEALSKRLQPGGQTGAELPIAFVGERPIDVVELLSLWLHRDSRSVAEMVETLVAAHLAERSAQDLGVSIDPDRLDAEVRIGRRLIEEQLAAGGAPISLEEYVKQELFLDPDRYLERLREDTRRQLLAERVVRAWTLSNEHAIARVIVVPSETRLAEAQAELAAGRDFADVAREHSIDPSARSGGLAPPIVRLEQSPMARLAFTTPIGEVGGPLEMMGQHMLLKVESVPDPLRGTWSEIEERIEASLAERPVEDGEYLQWKLAQEIFYGVDRTPFFELLGEPAQ